MRVKEIMTKQVIGVRDFETVSVAARTLEQYNIGALPVIGPGGGICGLVTDRDMVTRCLAANREPTRTTVGQIMTNHITSVTPETDVATAAYIMGKHQIRRLPVLEEGKLCGMVSLGDLANREDNVIDAADALAEITANVCQK